MRKLLYCTLGFGAACALGVYLLPLWLLLLLGGLAGMMAALMLFVTGTYPGLQRLQLLCLGFFMAAVWYGFYDSIVIAPVRALDGETLPLRIEVTDYSYPTDYGIAVEGSITLGRQKYSIKFYLNDAVSPLEPGDQVSGSFRLRYTGYGSVQDPTYHSADGIFLLAYPRGEHSVTVAETKSWTYGPAYLRSYLLSTLESIFPDDTVAFVKALLLGDTSELSYETDTALSLSGIRHVAAVSGLHVSILFSLLFFLTGRESNWAVFLGLPALLVFAAMAGFSPSVTRACLMQGLMLLSLLLRKEYDPPTSLAFAVLVMLSVNPLVITSVGFQLSVASVAGIFLFTSRITGWLLAERRLGRWKKKKFYGVLIKISTSVGTSLGALVLTTPLTAWYFGNVGLMSVLTNLLCLWMITGIFCGIILACILSAVWLPAGKLLAGCVSWVVRLVLGISGVIADFPLSAVYTESVYIVFWLIFCYILLAVFLLSPRKQPVTLFCCAVISLCVALLASWAEPLMGTYQVRILDVGQGQCVLLQSGGKTYMVDCGGEYDESAADKGAANLLSQGITELDGLILTHYDKDHVGGAAYLLSRIPTQLLVLPDSSGAEKLEADILSKCTGQVFYGRENMTISWDSACIRIYASFDTKTSNESSLCVLFHTEKCDILITGDRSQTGEEFLLRSGSLPKLDALIVGHHGSGNSTGEALLEVTRPVTAVISVGENNRYNHPAQAVLDRLTKYGCMIRRTDLEGTIILRG